jgi:hypothetical protein
MKYHDRTVALLLLAVLCASIAVADGVITRGPVVLQKGASNVSTHTDMDACRTAASVALVTEREATKKPAKRYCREEIATTYTKPAVVEKWVPLALFGRLFTLDSPATIRYGHKDYLQYSVQKDLPAGTYGCDWHQFTLTGSVPSPRCEMRVLAAEDGWDYLGIEEDQLTMPYDGVVRFAPNVAGTGWAERTLKKGAVFACHASFFGSVVAWEFVKVCKAHPTGVTPQEVTITQPAIMSQMVGMPRIDNTKIPPPGPFGRVGSFFGPAKDVPVKGGGEFRIPCLYSHTSFNDPIVYPGKEGAAHLHTFFGATNADAFTTQESLKASPSTCAGGQPDQSAYWIPSVLGENGLPVYIREGLFYYKVNSPPNFATVIWPPNGLKMITGAKAMNDDPNNVPEMARASFPCMNAVTGDVITNSFTFPKCPPGQNQWIAISFPNCWDGVNLDSPDHRSHVAFAGSSCPASHPVQLVQITLIIRIAVPDGADTSKWKLSSDKADLAFGGASMHADVWVQWDDTADVILRNCIRKSLDCHTGILGDGRQLN